MVVQTSATVIKMIKLCKFSLITPCSTGLTIGIVFSASVGFELTAGPSVSIRSRPNHWDSRGAVLGVAPESSFVRLPLHATEQGDHFDHLFGLDVSETVNTGDTVTNSQDLTGFLEVTSGARSKNSILEK